MTALGSPAPFCNNRTSISPASCSPTIALSSHLTATPKATQTIRVDLYSTTSLPSKRSSFGRTRFYDPHMQNKRKQSIEPSSNYRNGRPVVTIGCTAGMQNRSTKTAFLVERPLKARSKLINHSSSFNSGHSLQKKKFAARYRPS